MPTYSGKVVDSQNGAGIPRATVTLMRGGVPFLNSLSDNEGNFRFDVTMPADKIYFSSVGYRAWNFPASEYQNRFELERDVREIDPVVLPPYPVAKRGNWGLLTIGALLAYLLSKK